MHDALPQWAKEVGLFVKDTTRQVNNDEELFAVPKRGKHVMPTVGSSSVTTPVAMAITSGRQVLSYATRIDDMQAISTHISNNVRRSLNRRCHLSQSPLLYAHQQ